MTSDDQTTLAERDDGTVMACPACHSTELVTIETAQAWGRPPDGVLRLLHGMLKNSDTVTDPWEWHSTVGVACWECGWRATELDGDYGWLYELVPADS
jgi:hypothetical protein